MKVEYLKESDSTDYYLINDKLLTSKFSIEYENKVFLNNHDFSYHETIYIILGLSSGVYISEILEKIDDKSYIFVYEPVQEIIDVFCERYKNLFDHEKLSVFNNIDSIFTYMNQKKIITRRKLVYSYGNYKNVFQDKFISLLKKTRNDSLNILTNEATINRFNIRFTKNIIRNYYLNEFDTTVSSFKNKFKNAAALVIAAGPSLEKNINLISSFNGVVISGGRTVELLREKDINVDFIVSIDGGDPAYDIMKGSLDSTIPLCTFLESNSNIVSEYQGPKIVMTSKTVNIIESKSEDRIHSGPSISNVAVDLARYIGCNEIVFVGQDLAFEEENHHAPGTEYEFDKDVNYIPNIEVKGFYGGLVKTDASLFMTKHWLEKYIDATDIKYYNCTEGGAYIEKATNIQMSEYLKINSERTIIDKSRIIKDTLSEIPNNSVLNKLKLDDLLSNIIEINKTIQEIIKKIESILSGKKYNLKSEKYIKIKEKKLRKIVEREKIFTYIFADSLNIYINKRASGIESDFERIYESNKIFYESLSYKFETLETFIRGIADE